MKVSRFNKIIKMDDEKKIAFNSMTCALAEVDNSFFDILNNIESIDYDTLDGEQKELVDNMLLGNYIVHDHMDEVKLVKYRHFNGKFNSSGLGLTIAPTLACNFACPYCYESEKKGIMSIEVQDAIVKMVEDHAKLKNHISVTWYGGEPLLAKRVIVNLSERIIEICKKYGVEYSAYIVTNGYLIDDDIIEMFKKYKIEGAQLTIDGPPDLHNKRRIHKGEERDTFTKILESAKKLNDIGSRLTIRINVDKQNQDYIEDLLQIIEDNGLKNAIISLGHVTAYTEACSSVSESCLDTEEYAKFDLKYQQILFDRGFNPKYYPYYPGIKANYCCADSTNSFVLDPEGYMYKCWNDVGNVEKAVGQVQTLDEDPDEKMYMQNVDYMLWTPFDHEKCVECNLLPICMGGCPFKGIQKGNKPDCEKWKYSLDEVLANAYKQRASISPDEAACSNC